MVHLLIGVSNILGMNMEGLDIRTLALTNLWLGMFLGVGSLVFARIHPLFISFKQLGVSYFLFSIGFFLLSGRGYIPDFISIIVANMLIYIGFTLLIWGVLKFLHVNSNAFEKISILLLTILLILFVIFTYALPNIGARVVSISVIIASISFYAGLTVLRNYKNTSLTFMRFLGGTFIFCSFIYMFRVYLSIRELYMDNFIVTEIIHALSLIMLQFVTIVSCFSLTITASQQLAQKLAVQASTDSLTGIYNRRAFDELAEKSTVKAQRERQPISIIIMDIDFFKQVNDQYGHQIGDRVLQEFSLRLKSSLRQYDILARYGGEEFTLLLPDTNVKTAMIIAEKLRVKIAQPLFILENSTVLSVTSSLGVVTSQEDNKDWQQLISFADQALYQAKESGRNCVKLYTGESEFVKLFTDKAEV